MRHDNQSGPETMTAAKDLYKKDTESLGGPDFNKWLDQLELVQKKYDTHRDVIKQIYGTKNFEFDEDHNEKIYYGGDLGNEVFQNVSNIIVGPELQDFLREALKELQSNSSDSFMYVGYVILKLAGRERSFIADLTKTIKFELFGILSHDSNNNGCILDEISVWRNWYNVSLEMIKNIFQEYSCKERFMSQHNARYLLENKLDPTKLVTFVVDEHIESNKFDCYVIAGDKEVEDHKLANLSSVIFKWVCETDNILDVYGSDLIQDLYCVHQACYQPLSKIIRPLCLAIQWDRSKQSIDQLKMYLGQFFWRISCSTTFYRGQSAISEWIVKAVFKSHGFDNFCWPDKWTGSNTASPDQHALLHLFVDDFVKDFVSGVRL